MILPGVAGCSRSVIGGTVVGGGVGGVSMGEVARDNSTILVDIGAADGEGISVDDKSTLVGSGSVTVDDRSTLVGSGAIVVVEKSTLGPSM